MGHLSERLQQRALPSEADRAWALLRDRAQLATFVAHVLGEGEADRVALPLADRAETAHLIVTREGRGVTCLGAGMAFDGPKLSGEHVARYLAAQDEGLRLAKAEARFGEDDVGETLIRATTLAYRLTREEFDSLRAVAPLLTRYMYEGVKDQVTTLVHLGRQSVRQPAFATDDSADAQWSLYTSAATLLLACANERDATVAAVVATDAADTILAGRALWILVNWPERTLEFAERALAADMADLFSMTIMPLMCIRARFSWHRKSVEALLAQLPKGIGYPAPGVLVDQLVELCTDVARAFHVAEDARGERPPPAAMRADETDLAARLFARCAPYPDAQRTLEVLQPLHGIFADPVDRRWPTPGLAPHQPARAALCRNVLLRLHVSPTTISPLAMLWSVAPFDALAPAGADPTWRLSEGRRYVREQLPHFARRRYAVETVRATPTTGRNEACPCGSGKKFKRCHGA